MLTLSHCDFRMQPTLNLSIQVGEMYRLKIEAGERTVLPHNPIPLCFDHCIYRHIAKFIGPHGAITLRIVLGLLC